MNSSFSPENALHRSGKRPRFFFIVNPVAGVNRTGQRWDAFKSRLEEAKIDFEHSLTNSPGHAFELARMSAPHYEVLVAVGGDGTIREVAEGMVATEPSRAALGIVPFGTGNDVAQVLGIRTEPEAFHVLSDRMPKSIDLIHIACESAGKSVQCHGLLFAGAGIIAESLKKTTAACKWLFGQRLAYPAGLVRALCGYHPPQMRVTFDQEVLEEEFLFVGASNTEIAGGGMRIAPGARIDDGVLNLNLVMAMSRWRALMQLRRLGRGQHLGHPKMRYILATTLQIEATPQIEIAVDGDLIGCTPAVITVKPRALRVLAPPASRQK